MLHTSLAVFHFKNGALAILNVLQHMGCIPSGKIPTLLYFSLVGR